MSTTTDIKNWVAENPKRMGILWAIALIVAETGNVAAGHAAVISGP